MAAWGDWGGRPACLYTRVVGCCAQVLGEALKSIGKSLDDGEIDYDEFSKVAMASHSAASKKG